jgi:hypothetical protein
LARHDLCDDEVDCDELSELIDELRYIKLCAESHLFELSGYATRE